MTRSMWRIALGVAVLVVMAACGGGAQEAEPEPGATQPTEAPEPTAPGTAEEATTPPGDAEPLELLATIPFPSGIVFYPLYVAEANGYFAEEGLSVETIAVDGSGQILQQLLAGQSDVGLPSPGPFMSAVLEGAGLLSVYTLFQSNVFSLQTLEDSDVKTLADLEGKVVGVGTIEGGETPFVRAILAEEAGLTEGEDYELLAVGDGGTAAVALTRGEAAAYAAAFPDVAIMRLRGLELRDLLTEEYQRFFDSLVVFPREFVEANPEAVEGFGRAIAKATVWGFDHQEEVLDIIARSFPEEIEDPEFALALLQETQSLFELPAEAGGRWGYAVPEAVERYMGFLVDQGELAEPIDTSVFVNDFVDAYNAFDEDDL